MFGLRLTSRRKCYFWIFIFFIFSNFKWLLSYILWKNHPLWQWVSRVFLKFYYVTSFFNLQIFNNETTVLLKFFEICADMHFVSLICLNERSITTSLLVIDLKCTVVHYANLNSSSINKLFLNYELSNMLFRCFFYFLFLFILTRLLSKTLWKNYPFLTQIFKIHFKM